MGEPGRNDPVVVGPALPGNRKIAETFAELCGARAGYARVTGEADIVGCAGVKEAGGMGDCGWVLGGATDDGVSSPGFGGTGNAACNASAISTYGARHATTASSSAKSPDVKAKYWSPTRKIAPSGMMHD